MITKEQYRYILKTYLGRYPIGKTGKLSLAEEYAKISLISYIIGRDMGIKWESSVLAMCEMRGFNGNRIPMTPLALKELGVKEEFIVDYDKIQYLREQNKEVMIGMERLVINYINTR